MTSATLTASTAAKSAATAGASLTLRVIEGGAAKKLVTAANVTSLLQCANFAAVRTALGLVVGTDVQAYNAQLADVAGLTPSDNGVIIGNGANFVVESGATLRTSLGLAIGSDVQAFSSALATYAGISPSANVQTLLGSADYSAFRTSLGVAIGANVQAYSANLTTFAGIAPSANVQSVLGAADYAAIRALLDLEAGTDFYSKGATDTLLSAKVATSRNLTAGTGLTGGGDLSADRTFALSFLGLEALTDPGADRILFWDESDNAFKWLQLGTNLSISGTTLNASGGGGGGLTAIVEDTAPQLGGTLDTNAFNIQFDHTKGVFDDSNNEHLLFNKTSSAVNYLSITNAAAGGAPQFSAAGDDSNVSLKLNAKGTGQVWFSVNGSIICYVTSTTFVPNSNDGAALGSASLSWSDLFLASGAVLNFANGDAVVTHSSGVLSVTTGDLRVSSAGSNSASVVTNGGAQTLTNKTLTSPTINGGALSGTFTGAHTLSGLVSLTGGADLTPAATPSTTAVGYLGAPQNSQSSAYTFVMSDAGKHIYHPDADTTGRTWTIPANASVAYPIGTVIVIQNGNGAGAITLAITSDTLRWGSSTGSRTIAANGTATILKVTSTVWRLTGDGIT